MGLPDGEYDLSEMRVQVTGDRATLVGCDTLAGRYLAHASISQPLGTQFLDRLSL